MTLNLAIDLSIMALSCAQPGTLPPQKTIVAMAWVNQRVKDIDGNQYRLIAVHHAPDKRGALGATNAGGRVVIVNRQREFKFVRAPDEKDPVVFADKLPPSLELWWMTMPAEGNVEVLAGTIHFGLIKDHENPEELRNELLKVGYVPYSVSVDKLSKVQADSAADLVKKMKDLVSTNGQSENKQ